MGIHMKNVKPFVSRWVLCAVLHGLVTGLFVLWALWRMPSDGWALLDWAAASPAWMEAVGWAWLPFVALFDEKLPDALLAIASSIAWGALLSLVWTMLRRRRWPGVPRAETESVSGGAS